MKKFRTAAVCAGMALGMPLLAACGGGDQEASADAYCDQVAGMQDSFDALDAEDMSAFNEAIESFNQLADDAPQAVEAEWATMTEGMNQMAEALEGIDMEASQDDPEKAMEAMAAMREVAENLDQDALDSAGQAITEHAKDECGVDLEG